jgi:alpha-L-fucosidase 2
MLLQSDGEEIELLPALPAAWPDGAVRGLRARGGFTVDIAWRDDRLDHARIRPDRAGTHRLRYGEETTEVALAAGEDVVVRYRG